ncbi:helix-turn-helix transcriptional regulator [Yinghuangia aomiensis]|uniref:Helix-turn-helix transcriptional regulator n=1 Tax=Yinghuangia aomiensis TaxID=676205 RepID=A0ABP9H2L2_9ACTN
MTKTTGPGGGEPEPSDSLRAFGAAVRAFRKRAGMSRAELGTITNYSADTVASIELGRRMAQPDFIAKAGPALDAHDVLAEMTETLERRKGLATWFHRWADLEDRAISLYTYECRVVPGLLQTEAYARAVITSVPPVFEDEEVEQRIAERLARQSILTRKPLISLSFIIEQAVLERQTGGPQVTGEQIDRLLEVARLRNVELQIMPLRRPQHAGHDGPMQLLEAPDHRWLGYFEGQRGSALITDPDEVSIMARRYAIMRSQALNAEETVSLLERMRGDL